MVVLKQKLQLAQLCEPGPGEASSREGHAQVCGPALWVPASPAVSGVVSPLGDPQLPAFILSWLTLRRPQWVPCRVPSSRTCPVC